MTVDSGDYSKEEAAQAYLDGKDRTIARLENTIEQQAKRITELNDHLFDVHHCNCEPPNEADPIIKNDLANGVIPAHLARTPKDKE